MDGAAQMGGTSSVCASRDSVRGGPSVCVDTLRRAAGSSLERRGRFLDGTAAIGASWPSP